MSDLAQKRSVLEPFLASKKYNICVIGRPNEHSETKKFCKKFLSYIDPFDNCGVFNFQTLSCSKIDWWDGKDIYVGKSQKQFLLHDLFQPFCALKEIYHTQHG